MGWKITKNTAQFQGASWKNLVHKESNCTHEKARRIAFMKTEVTFYFFCREYMILEGHGEFVPGDAVFFSGEPWLGSAPQCDTYEKQGVAVVYSNPNNVEEFKKIATDNINPDGSSAVDVVCLYAANYCTNEIPMLRANNNSPHTEQPFNENIQDVLSSDAVKHLQSKGIVVLLTILNGHSEVGWSQFTCKSTAEAFVDYLNGDVLEKYGLDGIDINDQFSNGTIQSDSLAMVSTVYKQKLPQNLLTKALYDDLFFFKCEWEGHVLSDNLDYGWQINYYGGGPKERLRPYADIGMKKNVLVIGFSANFYYSGWGFPTIGPVMEKTMELGYGGGLLADFEWNPKLIATITNAIADNKNLV